MTDPEDHLRTVQEARLRIPVGATLFQTLINRGEIRSVKVHGRRLIPESAIREYIAGLQVDGGNRTEAELSA